MGRLDKQTSIIDFFFSTNEYQMSILSIRRFRNQNRERERERDTFTSVMLD